MTGLHLKSCDHFSDEQLADLYNRTRRDYLVPMLTTPSALSRYIHTYDVNRSLSQVALDGNGVTLGLLMVGLRGNRAWLTRVGVVPEARRHYVADALMAAVLPSLANMSVQLEFIQGNEAADRFFARYDFVCGRDLVVLQRPVMPVLSSPEMTMRISDEATLIQHRLAVRDDDPTWIEENASLEHMEGLHLIEFDGVWLVFQQTDHLAHLVFSPAITMSDARHLLHGLHTAYPALPAYVENQVLLSATMITEVFAEMGYTEVFRRTEMHRSLADPT